MALGRWNGGQTRSLCLNNREALSGGSHKFPALSLAEWLAAGSLSVTGRFQTRPGNGR